MLRWSHFAVLVLMLPFLCSNKKEVKAIDDMAEDEDKREEIGAKTKSHMCARLTESLATFIYIGAVFYA